MNTQKENKHDFFDHFAAKVTTATGSTAAILIAFGGVIVWAVMGPVFKYSEDRQMVINTGTTIITFLVVYLIQKSKIKSQLLCS